MDVQQDCAILNVLQSLPPVLVTHYFGPRSQMPRGHRVRGKYSVRGRVGQ